MAADRVQPVSPEIDEEALAGMFRQHFVETIVQRVADAKGSTISLEQRSAMAYFLNEAFRSMTLAEIAEAADIYQGWDVFKAFVRA